MTFASMQTWTQTFVCDLICARIHAYCPGVRTLSQPVSLCVCLSVSRYACLSVCCVCLSVRPFVRLSVSLYLLWLWHCVLFSFSCSFLYFLFRSLFFFLSFFPLFVVPLSISLCSSFFLSFFLSFSLSLSLSFDLSVSLSLFVCLSGLCFSFAICLYHSTKYSLVRPSLSITELSKTWVWSVWA